MFGCRLSTPRLSFACAKNAALISGAGLAAHVGVKMNGKSRAGLRLAKGATAIQTGTKNAVQAVRRGAAASQTRP